MASWVVTAVDSYGLDSVLLERHFEDGRLVEVVDLGDRALVRVRAPSGRVYSERTFSSPEEAAAAITLWDGAGEPQPRPWWEKPT